MTSDDVSQDEAVYSCHEGYQLVGVEKTYCQASGRWSGDHTQNKNQTEGKAEVVAAGWGTEWIQFHVALAI